MKEPSVLDYLKSVLNPWSKEKIRFPTEVDTVESESDTPRAGTEYSLAESESGELQAPETLETAETPEPKAAFPWLAVIALVIAICAQALLEPGARHVGVAAGGYALSAALFAVYLLRRPADIRAEPGHAFAPVQVKATPLTLSMVLALLAFLTFSNHQFGLFNTGFWLASIALGIAAFWQSTPGRSSWFDRLKTFLKKPRLEIKITPWAVLMLLAIALVVFFRFYRLNEVPGEMFSDHAEKLLDVADVLNGEHWIYFPRNTGREFIQMYLTAAVSKVFGTGLTFMSLKIGTALAGLLTLPFVYLLGKELGGRWTGLFTFVLMGAAYWPNVISRIGLRFPLYPLFAAPVLYYLIRAFRRQSFNDFLLAGLFLGLGLHGYSAMRFMPVVAGAAFLLYLLHPQSKGQRRQIIFTFLVLAFIALLVFMPLLRYMADDPDLFFYRSLSRLGTAEREYSQPVVLTFFSNLWKAAIMFFWDNGSIWVHSVPGRPALAVVPAALYFLGFVLVLIRYLRSRDWVDLLLLISVPLLLMPSVLSLAFPDENPSLNRTGAAAIPVFIMAAMLLDFVLRHIAQWRRAWGKALAGFGAVFLLLLTFNQDYQLIFRQFDQQFLAGAWNTSEIGQVVKGFTDSEIGARDSAWVVPFPHWVDTRLVGINAGFPGKDYALWPENFADTLSQSGAKLFIIKAEDQPALLDLKALYPSSSYWLHTSKIPGKDFWILLAPPEPTTVDVVE
jgi:4-amino-4-deoxy-L-arabinose transferase-like glycosyltransferase